MKTITVESKQQTVEFDFQPSWEELAQAEQIRLQRLRERQGRGVHPKLVIGVPIALAVVGIGLAFGVTTPAGVQLAAFIVLALVPVSYALGRWWVGRQERAGLAQARNQRPVRQRWVAGESGLVGNLGEIRHEIPWSSIRRIERLNKCTGLFVDEMHFYLIPDRAFVTEKQGLRFLRMVKANIGR